MKHLLYLAISLMSTNVPLLAMSASESKFLDQFCQMKVYQISDPQYQVLFKMALKLSIIRGHQLWGKMKHNPDISRSIPGRILATARSYIALWIRDQKKPLSESIQRVKHAIDEEYFTKIKSRPLPIRLLQGDFSNAALAPINAIYQYYGFNNFDDIREYLLLRCEKYDHDCAFVFFDTGVRRGLIDANGQQTGAHVLLEKMFVIETHDERPATMKRKYHHDNLNKSQKDQENRV